MLSVQVKVKRSKIGVFSWHHFAWAHCDRFDHPPKALELTAAVYWSLPMVQVWFSLFTHDSCFIYQLGCSQRRLYVSAVSSQILGVTDPPEGISCTDSHHLLAELCKGAELIQRLLDHQPQRRNTTRDTPSGDLASSDSIFSKLPSRFAAPSTALHHSGPQATFKPPN